MASYDLHKVQSHIAETQRLIEILKQTLERNFAANKAVDNVIEGIELELTLVDNAVSKLGGN